MSFTQTLLWAFLFLSLAVRADAAVIINEIAWMGTAVSGSDEWIELLNTGDSAADLSGWHLDATDGSPALSLSGAIAPHGYFLIERTDDSTVPDIAADLILPFGNGLSNAGETLVLKDASLAIVDTVIGGTDWVNIGGDNTTKETAQRTESGWITASGTPRAANAQAQSQGSTGEVLGAHTAADANRPEYPSSASVGGSAPQQYTRPKTTISVLAGDDQRAFTNVSVSFSTLATGLYGEALPDAIYRWNFGDGSEGSGRNVLHAYRFPGEYLVTVEALWGTYRETDRLSVVVADPAISVGKVIPGDAGYIELANRSDREIDLSGWQITSGTHAFVFPPHTVVPSGKNFILPNSHSALSFSGREAIALSYPDGTPAFSASTAGDTAVKPPPGSLLKNARPPFSAPPQHTPGEITPASAPTGTPAEGGSTTLWQAPAQGQAASAVIASPAISARAGWAIVSLVLALLALAGYFFTERRPRSPLAADEYAVIEDIIESEDDLGKESERVTRGR